MRSTLFTLLLVLALGLFSAPAFADPYFDTLGQLGDVYDDNDIFYVLGDHSAGLGGADWFQGVRFTSLRTGPLHSIDVAVGHLDASPQTIEFRLYADASGSLGSLLETIPVVATAANFEGVIERGLSASSTVLTAGNDYWLMATSVGPTIWFNNELGVSMDRLWTEFGDAAPLNSDTTTGPAFRLNAPPPVPLAGSIARSLLLALALAVACLAIGRGAPIRG